MPITAEDIFATPASGASGNVKPITAQDIFDAVPRDPKLQPHIVDQQGAPVDLTAIDSASSPQSVPAMRIELRPTGADQNVLPGNAGFGANFKQAFVEDPATKIRIYAKSMFPNDPNAERRFGVRDGRIVYLDDQGNIRDVEHGFGSRTGNALGYSPETAGAIIGSFATGHPAIGGGLGAAAGKGIKQMIGNLVFDEPQTMAGNAKGMAGEGLVNFAAGGVAKGVGKFFNKGRVVDFTPAQVAEAQNIAQQIEKRLGIKLDLSQSSQDPILMALRKYAAKYPGQASQVFKNLDEQQTAQSAQAFQKLLGQVASDMSSEAAGAKGINAAAKAIKDARASVSAEVKPLYDAAYNAVPEVDRTTKVGERILDYLKLPYFREAFSAGQKLRALETGSGAQPLKRTTETLSKSDPAAGTWESASTSVQSTGTNAKIIKSRLSSGNTQQTAEGKLTQRTDEVHRDITRPSLAELDYTKRALDEQIQSLLDKGQRQRAAALIQKRNEFVEALDSLPNQEWQAARQRYGELAKERIAPLEEGAIGVLANTPNRKAATVAAKMFTDPNITANEIAFARGAIEKADPEAWRALTRQYLASTLNKSLKVTQQGETRNLAGKLYQSMAGTPEQLAKLRKALPSDAQDTLNDVLGAFRLIAATERAGSDTAFNQLLTKKIEGRFSTTLKMLRQPIQQLIESGEQNQTDKLVMKLAEGLTDPAKVQQLRQVTKASPSAQRAIHIASILIGGTGERYGEGEVNPLPDRPIPQLEPLRGAGRQAPRQGTSP